MSSENGPQKPLIRGNTGVQDALLHNPAQSPFAYQAPMTCCNYIDEEIIIRPQNFNGMPGNKYSFQINKQCDLIGPITLVVNYKPLTQPNPPANNFSAVRYINNLGIGQIDFAQIRYGSQVLCNCLPEKLYIRYRKFLNFENFCAWRVLSKMDQTLGERNTFATSGGEVYTSMCIPWGDDTSQYFSMCGMADALYIDVAIKPINQLLCYDLVDPTQPISAVVVPPDTTQIIADMYLHYQGIHLTGIERDQVVSNVKSPNGQAKIIDDVQSHLRVLIPVASSNFTYQLRLTNITGPVTTLWWFLTDPQDNSGSPKNTLDGGDHPLYPCQGLGTQWSTYQVTSGGNNVVPLTSSLRARFMHHSRWWSGCCPGEWLVGYSFSQAPEVPNASYGSLNFGTIDTPTLMITFPSGLNNNYAGTLNAPGTANIAQGAWLNVIADVKNFFHEQGGDFVKTFY